ncbi:MAG: DUF1059 domain-containing protein [Candidatus Marsarchaeota archaeon]|nr:DUF1059 domain-containing protein [Candidatus Marsarchaeota archaeon]
MKKFACKDIGMQCLWWAQAANEDMLMKKIQKHAANAHNMQQIDTETMRKIKGAIRDA